MNSISLIFDNYNDNTDVLCFILTIDIFICFFLLVNLIDLFKEQALCFIDFSLLFFISLISTLYDLPLLAFFFFLLLLFNIFCSIFPRFMTCELMLLISDLPSFVIYLFRAKRSYQYCYICDQYIFICYVFIFM